VLSDTKDRIDAAGAGSVPVSSKWAYAATIFLSAFLLFQVQPILAKLVLPWFGGAAAVWTISLAFYQLTYLFGNAYAHFLIQRGDRLSFRLHSAILLSSLLLLPILPSPFWQPSGNQEPTWRILGLLAATVGLPFLLLSATSPLLQAWYARNREGAQPYRFYALSNAGSILALLSYPVLVEPLLATRLQARIWSLAYGAFAILCGAMAFRQPAIRFWTAKEKPATDRPGWKLQLLWLFLAATPSALLLSITRHISENIAAVPLLWIVPLALYLLSLIGCFEGHRWYRRSWFLRLLPVALGGMAYALLPQFENAGPPLTIPLYCAGLFICCMVCHGEMADLKPRPQFLTHFYLMVSAGGALGGIFVALVAPRIFRGLYELPLSLGMCAIAVLIALLREPRISSRRLGAPVRLAAAGMTLLLLGLLFNVVRQQSREALVMVRNFYGVLRVNIVPPGAVRPAVTQLRNGTIVHGEEILDSARNDVPTTYYGEHSGVGITLLLERQGRNIRVGAIGLGIGTVARYGQKGDRYAFYEINPLDVDLAKNLFDFLGHADAQVNIVPGDGRLSLEREPPQQFAVLIVDAFSGDAIPVHLLTREAFELYFRHLEPHGVLAIHVSNRFLDLPPVVEADARAVGARAVQVTNEGDDATAVYESTWMLVDRPATPSRTVSALIDATVDLPSGTTVTQKEDRVVRPWTDDYSNLLRIVK
jgi:hypothetical protein